MTQTHKADPLIAPEFIREREAWYKAGAHAMALYSGLTVLLVGVIIGIASLLLDIGPYQVAVSVVVGTWAGIAAAGFYAEVTARGLATRGGVQIDRF